MDSGVRQLCVSYRGDGEREKWEKSRAAQVLWAIRTVAILLVSSADTTEMNSWNWFRWGRNVFHFSFQGVMVSFCPQNCKVRCSIDKSRSWIDGKVLKRLEISLDDRKWNCKNQRNGDGSYFSRDCCNGSKASYHMYFQNDWALISDKCISWNLLIY